MKGPHSKCGRSGNRRMGSNPIISAKKDRDLSTGAVKFGLFVCCERTALSHRRLLDNSKELTRKIPHNSKELTRKIPHNSKELTAENFT